MQRYTMRDHLAGAVAVLVLLASGCHGLNQQPDPFASQNFSIPDPTPSAAHADSESAPAETEESVPPTE